MQVGLDMVEISRMAESLKRPRFFRRIFGAREQEELAARKMSPQSAAAAFAAKEAFAKALGTGFRGFALCEVELLHDDLGAPYLALSGKAQEIARERGWSFSVSLTHTKELAAAVVVAQESRDRK